MTISPQSGHRSFVASSSGGIILLHEVHVGIKISVLSLMVTPRSRVDIDATPLYVLSFNEFLKLVIGYWHWKIDEET